MKSLTLTLCFVISAVAIVSSVSAVSKRDNFDLLLNLLPLYGGFNVNRLITSKSLDKVVGFFKSHKTAYESFRKELATEGVFLPPLKELKLNAITKEDYASLQKIIGDKTRIRDAVSTAFVKRVVDAIKADQLLLDNLLDRISNAGIKLGETVELASVGQTILDAFEPFVTAFIPTGISIVIG